MDGKWFLQQIYGNVIEASTGGCELILLISGSLSSCRRATSVQFHRARDFWGCWFCWWETQPKMSNQSALVPGISVPVQWSLDTRGWDGCSRSQTIRQPLKALQVTIPLFPKFTIWEYVWVLFFFFRNSSSKKLLRACFVRSLRVGSRGEK